MPRFEPFPGIRFAPDLVAGKKRFDRNGTVRGQVFMYRFLLSREGKAIFARRGFAVR